MTKAPATGPARFAGTTTANLAPVFDESSPTRSVTENTAAGQDIEHPVSATDAEGGTLTWRLEGPEAGSFDIVSGSGQLRTRAGVTYNYEVDDSYSVRVRVEDDQGGSTATEVTIHVEDVDEAPGRPAVPRITASTTHGLSVAWTAPANTGPPLGGYDLQYREGSSGAFTDGGRSTGTTAALTGLATGTDYEIQVRARNDEGDGPWSPSAAGRTTVNQAPAFAEGSSTVRTVAENTPAGRDIGGPVNANDRDGGTLMYRLEGPDAASFDLVSTSGQLRTPVRGHVRPRVGFDLFGTGSGWRTGRAAAQPSTWRSPSSTWTRRRPHRPRPASRPRP